MALRINDKYIIIYNIFTWIWKQVVKVLLFLYCSLSRLSEKDSLKSLTAFYSTSKYEFLMIFLLQLDILFVIFNRSIIDVF